MKELTEKLETDERRESVSEESGNRNQAAATEAAKETATNPDVLEPSEAGPETEDGKSLLLGKDEYEKLKYEAPLVKMLKEVEVREEGRVT